MQDSIDSTEEQKAPKRTRTRVEESGLVKVDVYCVGLTPILFNRVQEETLLGLRDKTKKKAKTAPAPKEPREEATPKLHTLNDGETPIIPMRMLFAALVDAGKYVRLDGKRQISNAKGTTLPGFVTMLDQYLRILNPNNLEEIPNWEVDIQGGRNPNGGELVCIVRPRFDVWAFRTTILVNADSISVDRIRELFDIAGRRSGLGDFRPNRKGFYGQFRVECWTVKD